MLSRKDSDDAIEFMSLFVKLKHLADDDPNKLADLATADAAVRRLCERLSGTAWLLQTSERRYRRLFVAPVDPKFIKAWRDFEHRYQRVLIDLVNEDLFSGMEDVLAGLEDVESKPPAEADPQWEFANNEATEQASAIECRQSTSRMTRQLRTAAILMPKENLERALKTARQPGCDLSVRQGSIYAVCLGAAA